MKLKIAFVAAAATLMASAPAHAAAFVTSIKITNALGTYLQVAEVIASQVGTGVDVASAATGATAIGSSTYSSTSGANNAIDGLTDGNYYDSPGIFHAAGQAGDYLLVTFAHGFDLSSLSIFGRTDCCSERDVYGFQAFNGTTLVQSGQIDATGTTNSGSATLSAAVPEPASWAMMLLGFGMVGFGLRNRRNQSVRVAFA